MRRAGRRLVGAASTLAAGLGALCLVLTVVAPALGVRTTFVTSGSMQPSIGVGALVLTRTVGVAEVGPGDVVGVRSATGGGVLHRVVERTDAGLVLRGDANAVADPSPYDVASVERPLLVVPGVGHVVAAAGSVPAWVLALGGVVLLGRLTSLGKPPRRPDPATA